MSQQAPPTDTPLSTRDDKETIALLDALDNGPVKDLEANKKALRTHLGNRIAGDLRVRVLAGQTAAQERDAALSALASAEARAATAEQEVASLKQLETKAGEEHAKLKKAMLDKGIKLP